MMKLHWFSPLPPAKTDIANYTARLLPALAEHAEVTLWTEQTEWDPSLEEHARVRSFGSCEPSWPELNYSDLAVYNIGNDARFHSAIFAISRQHPGLVVLHDFHLHEFFAQALPRLPGGQSNYTHALGYHHGPLAQAALLDFRLGRIGVEEMATLFPLTSLATESAEGVLVHNAEKGEELAGEVHCPLFHAPLPYSRRDSLRPVRPRTRSVEQELRMVTFGFFGGENRRLLPILEAMAAFPQKERLRLDVYGEILIERPVREALARLGLEERVVLHGFVPEPELDAALDRADLALNLRYPSRGEASGSLLRIWNHACPCLITRTGWYARVAPDTAFFVDPENEQTDLHAHWSAFLTDPAPYFARGENGRTFLESEHTVERYVERFLPVVEEVSRGRAASALHTLGRRWARQIALDVPAPAGREYLLYHTAREISGWIPGTTSAPRPQPARAF